MDKELTASVPTSLEDDPREEREEAVTTPGPTAEDPDHFDADVKLYPNPDDTGDYPKLRQGDIPLVSLCD